MHTHAHICTYEGVHQCIVLPILRERFCQIKHMGNFNIPVGGGASMQKSTEILFFPCWVGETTCTCSDHDDEGIGVFASGCLALRSLPSTCIERADISKNKKISSAVNEPSSSSPQKPESNIADPMPACLSFCCGPSLASHQLVADGPIHHPSSSSSSSPS